MSVGNTYYYRVKATNNAGDLDYCDAASAATAQAVPVAPGGLIVSGSSMSSIHLSWVDNSANEASFRIERSPDGSTGWTPMKDVAANLTPWDDTGLPAATAYFYRVKAMNSAGDSAYSSAVNSSTFFISMIAINAAGDSFIMGDGPHGPTELFFRCAIRGTYPLSWMSYPLIGFRVVRR